MYELTKKKKSLVGRIVIFLIACGIISEILSILSGTSRTIDDGLMKTAQEINRHCPIIIDSSTRLDNAAALSGRRLLFNYTLLGGEEIRQIDTTAFKAGARESIINMIATDPKFKQSRKDEIGFAATFYDEQRHYICGILVEAKDYK